MSTKVTVRPLSGAEAPVFASMTFPIYRGILSLEPQPLHPEQGDERVIQPVALAAMAGRKAIGLAVGELPTADERPPRLLSVFTHADARGHGIGTALVAGIEDAVARAGLVEVTTSYMTGKPGIDAFERILEKRGWSAPEVRTMTLKFTPEEALRTPWFGRLRLKSGYELFPWEELADEERAELRRSQRESPWIPDGLEPWRHDSHDFDRPSSIGLRRHGEVVGWVINHRVAPDVVRFTCSYMRKDISRRGRILPLYTASLRKLHETGCRQCMFVTPVAYEGMVKFIEKRCAPWASFFGETRGSRKELPSS